LYFLNACEQISDFFLKWLSDFESQKKGFISKRMEGSYDSHVEAFAEYCSDLFETDEYKKYGAQQSMQLLKELYILTNDHWYEMAEKEEPTGKQLFNDPKWIEIKELAKRTKELLDTFIKIERERIQNYE